MKHLLKVTANGKIHIHGFHEIVILVILAYDVPSLAPFLSC